MRTLPTICVHICSVARVSSHPESVMSGRHLVGWLGFVGGGFLLLPATSPHHPARAIRQTFAAMSPLGLARAGRLTNDTVTTIAGAPGFVVIALQIASPPSLSAAFNRREV